MNKEQSFFLGFLFGVIFIMILMIFTTIPKDEIVKHKCARYNPITTEFEWIDKGERR